MRDHDAECRRYDQDREKNPPLLSNRQHLIQISRSGTNFSL
jgi:hypothetical protein